MHTVTCGSAEPTLSDIQYMRRAIQLARCGYGFTYTNPMVGALVVAPSGRIIGQGWHRLYGGPHAEVNALESVSAADRHLIPQSTVYVTLEPCAHHGKTPPCASRLIDAGVPRVVIGASDPFPEVAGRGIRMLREAGREVLTGVLEEECSRLNLPFMTAHRLHRPFVMLKWAQSADAFIAPEPSLPGEAPAPRMIFSTEAGQLEVQHLRASFQAILVGVNTIIDDDPYLECRRWPVAYQPRPATRRSARIPEDSYFMMKYSRILREPEESLPEFLTRLYEEEKIVSLLVEGGSVTLQEFIDMNLFDMLRVETAPRTLFSGVKAPDFNPAELTLTEQRDIGPNRLQIYSAQ